MGAMQMQSIKKSSNNCWLAGRRGRGSAVEPVAGRTSFVLTSSRLSALHKQGQDRRQVVLK